LNNSSNEIKLGERVNIREWIEKHLDKDEIIEAVTIGDFNGYEEEEEFATIQIPKDKKHNPLKWEEGKKYLDYEFTSDYAEGSIHPFIIWTNKRIFFTTMYDGLVKIKYVPRNPEPFKVEFYGGGW